MKGFGKQYQSKKKSNKKIKPSKEQIINQAFKFHSQGNISKAEKLYKQFIDKGFRDQRVFSNYGVILKNLGNLQEAELTTRKALELNPNDSMAHSNLGSILTDQRKLKEAELSTRKAIELNPNLVIAHTNMGSILRDLGNLQEAELSTRKAIELNPNSADAHSNLGSILKDQGKLKEAELSTRKAIEINPDLAIAYSNLGNLLRKLGKSKDAELSLRKAIELKQDLAEAHSNLGIVLKDLGKLKDAELSLRKAIELNPDLVIAYSNLAIMLSDLGKDKEAHKYNTFLLEKEPHNIYYYINAKLKFSPIMNNEKQIDIERKQYKEQLQSIDNNMYHTSEGIFNTNIFYLAYHNRSDDKQILEQLSNTISKIKGMVLNKFTLIDKKYSKSNKNTLKIGICSEYLVANHTVGKLYIKVILDLLKTDLDITIYIPPETRKINGQQIIRNSFKRIIDLPNSPIDAQKVIFDDNLDILFYPDIGMSTYTYILALSKLALVQVNGLGHANTSGIKNMDYFITSDIEPRNSDKNYTERLVRFPRLPFNYSIPTINNSKVSTKKNIDSKNDFNISLTQSLFKLHPSYDKILVSILKEVEYGRLILVKDKNDYITNALKDRWRRTNNLLIERSIFLNRMSQEDFINTTKSCHVMLDPFYFGSGNTFYESMAFGIPFITYPHNQKTKIPSAGYKQMKVKNPPIAHSPEDYINWCKLYSNNRSLLEETKNELIEKANKYLFNDREIYKEYYNFFHKAVRIAKQNI